jgi:hypothetical protein
MFAVVMNSAERRTDPPIGHSPLEHDIDAPTSRKSSNSLNGIVFLPQSAARFPESDCKRN